MRGPGRVPEPHLLGPGNVKVTVGEKLGTATEPPCDDTPNDGQDEPATPASRTAYAVEGVAPGIAIGVEGVGS